MKRFITCTALAALALTFGARGIIQAGQTKTPPRWTRLTRSVVVALPQGDQERGISYYRCPLRLPGPNRCPMEFVLIPAGELELGEKGTENHRVLRVEKPFFISATEVTQAQYKAVTGKNPSHMRDLDLPVDKVSPALAEQFCRQLSKRTGLTFRLPAADEWEFACRAGTTTRYYWGESVRDDCCWWGPKRGFMAQLPAQKLPNGYGLYDMAGNVQEWATTEPDPEADGSLAEGYVLCGGPKDEYDWSLASHTRLSYPDMFRSYNGCGLRLLVEVE